MTWKHLHPGFWQSESHVIMQRTHIVSRKNAGRFQVRRRGASGVVGDWVDTLEEAKALAKSDLDG